MSDVIVDYIKDRKEIVYFAGGLGIGAFLGKTLVFAAFLVGVGVYIWLKRKKKE